MRVRTLPLGAAKTTQSPSFSSCCWPLAGRRSPGRVESHRPQPCFKRTPLRKVPFLDEKLPPQLHGFSRRDGSWMGKKPCRNRFWVFMKLRRKRADVLNSGGPTPRLQPTLKLGRLQPPAHFRLWLSAMDNAVFSSQVTLWALEWSLSARRLGAGSPTTDRLVLAFQALCTLS